MNLGDILTPFEIDTVLALWKDNKETFHTKVLHNVCKPACARRNDVLPEYLAYLLEYTLTNAEKIGAHDWDMAETFVSTNETNSKPLTIKKRSARKMQSKLP